MLERSRDLYNQDSLFNLEEFKSKFPDSYLELNKSRFESGIDITKIPHVVEYAKQFREMWQEEAEILASGIINFSNLIVQERPDTVMLLDKSARPISHFLKSLWRCAYPECRTPNIRFVNIGREWSNKYKDEKLINQLYQAHFRYINGKNLIIADEFIEHGESITKAKKTIRRVFTDAKRLLCTGVFGDQPQYWYHPTLYLGLGVFDNMMPNDILYNVPEKDEPDTFVSKTIAGVARRHKEVRDNREYKEALDDTQKDVNEMHAEIGYLAKIIALNCNKISMDSVLIEPNLPWNVSYLNRII